MRVSTNFIRLLEEFEGRKNQVYNCPAGCPTIGIGHKLTDQEINSGQIIIAGQAIDYRQGLSDEQIDALVCQDAQKFEETVNSLIRVPLNQNQFDALVSFTFNIGAGALASSTLLKVLNGSNYTAVPEQMKRWKFSNGQVLPGLVTRRQKEADLFMTPVDELTEPKPDIHAHLVAMLHRINLMRDTLDDMADDVLKIKRFDS